MKDEPTVPVFKIAESVLGALSKQTIRAGLQTAEVVVSLDELEHPGQVLGILNLGLSKMAIPVYPQPLDPNADHPVIASALASDEATQVRVDVVEGRYPTERRVLVFAQRFIAQGA